MHRAAAPASHRAPGPGDRLLATIAQALEHEGRQGPGILPGGQIDDAEVDVAEMHRHRAGKLRPPAAETVEERGLERADCALGIRRRHPHQSDLDTVDGEARGAHASSFTRWA